MKKMYKPLFVIICFIVLSIDILAQAGTKANDQLSNLMAPTAVNVDLLPNADGLRNLGSPAFRWNLLHLKSLRLTDGAQALGKVLTSDANGVATWNSFVTGTTGSDFNINFSGGTHTFNLPSASEINRGLLTTTDWINFNAKQAALSGTGFVKISGSTISYDNSSYVPTSRTLTINGTTYDLSANRSWTINGTSLAPIGSSPNANGGTITGTVLNLQPASDLFGGVVTTGTQTFSGAKTFLNDITVTDLTIGKGGGNVYYNTAIGVGTLLSNTTGFQNTATGYIALNNNTTGYYNTANGSYALFRNTTGYFNTATGNSALSYNTTGYFNTANGTSALYSNTTGTQNTAVGLSSLYYNTTGSTNTANGAYALFSNTSGSQNTANGYGALNSNETGNDMVATGYKALYSNTTGFYNTANGSLALRDNTTGYGNTAIGYSSLQSNTVGFSNTANGWGTLSANTIGQANTANGAGALLQNTTGSRNTATGTGALITNFTGSQNSAFGVSSLRDNTTGSSNIAVGFASLEANTSGFNNTAIGAYALLGNTTGFYNTANGFDALHFNTTGTENTGVGFAALLFNTTGSLNTANGFYALRSNTTGIKNSGLGFQADVSVGDLNNAMALGYNTVVTASNNVRIGDSYITSIGGQVDWTTFSDGRYKRNIKNNVPGLEFITKLEPITYTLNVEGIENKLHAHQKEIKNDTLQSSLKSNITADNAMKEARNEKSKIVYTGFVAQDVEKVAKNIGYDFSGVDKPKDEKESFYGLRYAEFVVPLVKSVQELAKENEALKATNEALNERLNKIEATLGINKPVTKNESPVPSTVITLSSAKLDQNIPNPASQNTLINYYIPANTRSAEIQIIGIRGEIIKKVALPTKGNGQLKLQTALLDSGTYAYSLIVDGNLVDTKKMIMAR